MIPITPVAADAERARNWGRPVPDLARTTLGALFLVGLAGAAIWILVPFIPAVIWSTMIVVATWPAMLWVQARLRGKRWAAVTVMTLSFVLAFVVPFALAVMTIVANTEQIGERLESIKEFRLPPTPQWVQTVPVVGPRLAARWDEAAASGPSELSSRLEPHVQNAARWLIAQMGSVATLVLQLLLTVLVSAILFARGEVAAAGVRKFFLRLAGPRAEAAFLLAGRSIRGVALGVVLTAIIQSALGGIGLWVAGVPLAGMLTAIMFVLGIAQIGAGPVLILAVIWAYATSDSVWMPTVFLVWSVFVGTIDNVIRPMLIRMGGDLPLLIVISGVIGGLFAFGLVGIFVGPIVLAVAYTLLEAWVSDDSSIGDPDIALAPDASDTLNLPRGAQDA